MALLRLNERASDGAGRVPALQGRLLTASGGMTGGAAEEKRLSDRCVLIRDSNSIYHPFCFV